MSARFLSRGTVEKVRNVQQYDYSHLRDFDKLMSVGQSSTNRMGLNV